MTKDKVEIPTLRCIHRHDIKHHPACFAQGKIKWSDQQQRELLQAELYKEPKPAWFEQNQARIGYLDIETDGLKADFSTMLTWCIKVKGGEVIGDMITKQELFDMKFDERLIRSIVSTMKMFDIIVSYYGTVFDIAFIRSKALHYGIEFPSYLELAHWDLYYAVKSKLNLSSKSLANATNYFGIEGKTPIDKETWRRAKYGDQRALNEVMEHNVGDVIITEQLHDLMFPFSKWTRKTL